MVLRKLYDSKHWQDKSFMIFIEGEQLDTDISALFYNDNKPGNNDPSLIHEIERYHNNHQDPSKLTGLQITWNMLR
jgi:hypothetical protein